jgi:hypothetical protein
MLELKGYELSAIRKAVAVGEGWEQYIEFYNDELKVCVCLANSKGLLLYI